MVSWLRSKGGRVCRQLSTLWRRLAGVMRSAGRVVRAWFYVVLRFLCNAGTSVLRCLLSSLNWIGSLAIRWGKVWLHLAGAVVFGSIPCIFFGALLYVLVSYAKQDSFAAWFVLIFSPFISLLWIWSLTRHNGPLPMVLKGEYFLVFYIFSTFFLSTTLFACAYMAAGKLGDNVSDLATGDSLVRFWGHMRFSILTATTLGQASIGTKGISCVLECAEVIQFWFLIVIAGWKLQPRKTAEFGVQEILGPQKKIVEFGLPASVSAQKS